MAYSNLYARFYAFRQEVAAAFSALWRFKPSRIYLGLAGMLQIFAWSEAAYIYQHLSGKLLVLHYNIDFGIDLVGDPRRIFIYPAYGLAILALNWILAAGLHRRSDFRLFANLLLVAATIFLLLICLTLMFVYLINFR